MDKKVGIVMPCINLWAKYTLPALASVATAQHEALKRGIHTEVLLIDNASTDDTRMEASTRAGIRYHRNEEMWGFQRSVNYGINKFFNEGFDYVLVVNNDIVLHQHAIWRLVERFVKESKDDYSAVCPLAMATCLDATGECGRVPARISGLDDREKEACEETQNPCFSAFMINKDCWKNVGEFDEVFAPAYYEDNDYHYRIKLAQMMAITYPPAMFFHWGSATQLEALGRPLTNSANQHAQYIRKWGGDPGKEQFKTPYNDPESDIRMVKKTV